MKLKYGIAALLFGAAGGVTGWRALSRGQAGCAAAAVLLLTSAAMFGVRLFRQKPEAEKKRSRLPALVIAAALAATAAMPFVNGAVAFRPAYTYRNYYRAGRVSQTCFPAEIPADAAEVRFRVLGEGILGRPCYLLSFRTDEASAAALRETAAREAEHIAAGLRAVQIPSEIAPEFVRGDGQQQCDIYRFRDSYGGESFAFFRIGAPLVCYYEE